MKLNPDKCHLILSGKENTGINVGNVLLKDYRVFFDEKATFEYQIEKGV